MMIVGYLSTSIEAPASLYVVYEHGMHRCMNMACMGPEICIES